MRRKKEHCPLFGGKMFPLFAAPQPLQTLKNVREMVAKNGSNMTIANISETTEKEDGGCSGGGGGSVTINFMYFA